MKKSKRQLFNYPIACKIFVMLFAFIFAHPIHAEQCNVGKSCDYGTPGFSSGGEIVLAIALTGRERHISVNAPVHLGSGYNYLIPMVGNF